MAYVQSVDFISKKMREREISYFEIQDNDRSVIDINEDEDKDLEQAIQQLEETLHSLEGIVHITLRKTSKRSKAAGGANSRTAEIYKYSIRLGSGAMDIFGKGNSGAMHLVIEMMKQNNNLQIEQLKREYEYKEKLRELEDKKRPDPQKERFLNILEKMFDKNEGTKKSAGIGENTESDNGKKKSSMSERKESEETIQQDVSEETVRLRAVLKRLFKADSNLISNLEMLADLAERKPKMYAVAIDELMEQHAKIK